MQPPAKSGASRFQTWLLKALSKESESLLLWANLFQCLFTHSQGNLFSLYSVQTNLSHFSTWPLSAILLLGTSVRILAPPAQWRPRRHGKEPLGLSKTTSSGKTSSAPSAFPHRASAPAPKHLGGPPVVLLWFWQAQNWAQYSSIVIYYFISHFEELMN